MTSGTSRIATRRPPRQPRPSELLFTFEYKQDVYRTELRDFDPYGIETQIFLNAAHDSDRSVTGSESAESSDRRFAAHVVVLG